MTDGSGRTHRECSRKKMPTVWAPLVMGCLGVGIFVHSKRISQRTQKARHTKIEASKEENYAATGTGTEEPGRDGEMTSLSQMATRRTLFTRASPRG